MSKETITRGFRITEETAEKLKAICADVGNQNAALESLIHAYEMQKAATTLTEQKTDIEDYNSHLQALQTAFLHSLELTENTENRIRTEFQKQLDSKDNTIINLQESLKLAESNAQVADERATTAETNAQAEIEQQATIIADLQTQLENANQKAEEQAETIRTTKGTISDKEKIISSLQTELETELDTAKKNANSVPELITRATTAENSLATAQKEIESLKQAMLLAEERAEIALQKAVLAEQQKATESAKATTEEIKRLYSEIDKLRQELTQTTNKKPKKSKPSETDTTN